MDIGNLLEKIFEHFIHYITIFFCYWGGDRKVVGVALRATPTV
jgi:hypothetical protein